MRGSLVHHGKNRWSLVLDLGRGLTRKVKSHVCRSGSRSTGTTTLKPREQRNEAQAKLTELLNDQHKGTFVEPSKLTLIELVRDWLAKAERPSQWRPETVRVYKTLVEGHLAPSTVGSTLVQKLTPSALEHFYAHLDRQPSTVAVMHAVVKQALTQALRDHQVPVNVATQVRNRQRPRASDRRDHAREHCWSAMEARRFLDVAKTSAPQLAAFFAWRLTPAHGNQNSPVYLDRHRSGSRFADHRASIGCRGVVPVFGPTKTRNARRLVRCGDDDAAAGAQTETSRNKDGEPLALCRSRVGVRQRARGPPNADRRAWATSPHPRRPDVRQVGHSRERQEDQVPRSPPYVRVFVTAGSLPVNVVALDWGTSRRR